jgi:hypothetical protein
MNMDEISIPHQRGQFLLIRAINHFYSRRSSEFESWPLGIIQRDDRMPVACGARGFPRVNDRRTRRATEANSIKYVNNSHARNLFSPTRRFVSTPRIKTDQTSPQ